MWNRKIRSVNIHWWPLWAQRDQQSLSGTVMGLEWEGAAEKEKESLVLLGRGMV